jgi:hypothetical protein
MVRVKIFKKCNLIFKYFFSVLKKNKQKYLLGRRLDCDVLVNDPGFSREQATFFFDSSKQAWSVKDGGENPSRTGTW